MPLPLFPDLPDPEPQAIDAALPESLRLLLAAGYPGDAVEPLLRHYGGRDITVPKTPSEAFNERLGPTGAAVLCRVLGGAKWSVPRGEAARQAARNAALRRDYDAGTGWDELVRTYRRTQRRLREILGEAA